MRRTHWRPTNLAPRPLRVDNAVGTDGGAATLYIYDAIDSWGGAWGVSATDVVAALAGVKAGRIDVHLNSPGGDYFEAVAIHSVLTSHAADVHVYVDGIAASAASVIAMAGLTNTMAQGAQMMIHDPVTVTIGRADEMRAAADLLDKCADDIAGFYARKAGGEAADWRPAMQAETWYTADEAVAAGLADAVAGVVAEEEDPPKKTTKEAATAALGERWIAAAWKYAERKEAPEPAPIPDPLPAAIALGDLGAVIRAAVSVRTRKEVAQ